MRSVPSRALALVLVTLLTACAGAPQIAPASTAGHGSAPPRDLPLLDDRSVLEAMRAAAVPGLAVAYLRDCRVERVATYGVVDADSLAPVTSATVFEAASLSKPVFAYLVMQLVDSGRIDLDAPISRTLEYPRIRDRERYAAVTPRLGLSHSTGLPNWSGRPRDWERTDSLVFAFAPGAAFRYSGEGYQLTQVYAEHVTGRSLQELFRASLGEVMP
ncbi:MAG TPA: serine hydrolase domain-containing protein, partial [Gemmatimonadaceae bacterium]|nr:serine hydrolase domain-containing protein [Gemmatimonadaceae bacterium]